MVRGTPPYLDAFTHKILNSYHKEYRRFALDRKQDKRTDGPTDGRRDGQCDKYTTEGPQHGIGVAQFYFIRSVSNPKTMTSVSEIIQFTKTKKSMQRPVENSPGNWFTHHRKKV